MEKKSTDTTSLTRRKFVMWLEPHTPRNKNNPCSECVLASGPMCLDRTYCEFKDTGKTWKKIPNDDLE